MATDLNKRVSLNEEIQNTLSRADSVPLPEVYVGVLTPILFNVTVIGGRYFQKVIELNMRSLEYIVVGLLFKKGSRHW